MRQKQRKMQRKRWLAIMLAIVVALSSFVPSMSAMAEPVIPTYKEAYNKITALQKTYPEGMKWTNDVPYSSGKGYQWQCGPIDGIYYSSRGCMALAGIYRDSTFSNLPARALYHFTYDDIKVGDVLQVNNMSHAVVVWQKCDAGLLVVEGNYNGTVHWGRAMSKEEVMASTNVVITSYPENYKPADDATAYVVIQSGKEGSLNWSLTQGGILTISGTGAIGNYSPNDGKMPSWNTYNDKIQTVIVEHGITSIGNYAFYQSKAMILYLPETLTSIGQSAFYGSSLVAVTIPGSMKSIGNDAFRTCRNLTSATIEEGVATIGERAFHSCTALQYIDFPSSITSVGAGAFMSCTEMCRVRFKPSATNNVAMGDNIFSQCTKLVDVTLPSKTSRISAGMFQSCWRLSTLYIPATVTSIGENPFTSCNALTVIQFGGTEAAWNKMVSPQLSGSFQSTKTSVKCGVPYDDPFAEESVAEPSTPTPTPTPPSSHEHSYGDWVIDVAATTTQNGEKHRVCTVCGERQTESIPKLEVNTPAGGDTDTGGNAGGGGTGGSSTTTNPDSNIGGGSDSSGDSSSDNPKPTSTSKKKVKVKKLKIINAPKKLKVKKSVTLKVKVTPSNATNKKVTWKSSNKKYATVNSKGKVTAKKAGKGKTVKITATAKDGSKKKVTVKIKIVK